MLTRFTPSARQTLIRAGMLAAEAGRETLSTEFLLLALVEGRPLSRPLDLGVTGAAVRAEIEAGSAHSPRRNDRELLATLGIDLDEVHRRAIDATPGFGSAAAAVGH